MPRVRNGSSTADRVTRRLRRAAGWGAPLVVALLIGRPAPARAVMDASSECLFQFGGVPEALEDGGVIECTDCDPACDGDGLPVANGVCEFKLAICTNIARPGCR